jgi:hypothetical protein
MNLFTHVYVLCLCREMTWWSTLVSNLRVSASLLMGGCNLMGPAVWSLQSYLVTWAALRPWFVFWSQYAQSITKASHEGHAYWPVTILNWSFVRNNQSRNATFKAFFLVALCMQDKIGSSNKTGSLKIAGQKHATRLLWLWRDEVEGLEAGGVSVRYLCGLWVPDITLL